MNVIPAIDIKDGNCVRLFQGEFDRQTEYSKDPASVARCFENMGFSHLHLVDLDGAQSGKQKNRSLVEKIAAGTGFSVQLGGGIRDAAVVRGWLESGVDRCVIGSLAITDAATVKGWFESIGAARIVLALDVRIDDNGTPVLSTHGWTRDSATSLWDCVNDYRSVGLQQVLCTDISRDGAMSGPNVDLYREFVARYPGISLQASGGVRDIDDLHSLREAGASAAITGRALLDGAITSEEITSFLRAA